MCRDFFVKQVIGDGADNFSDKTVRNFMGNFKLNFNRKFSRDKNWASFSKRSLMEQIQLESYFLFKDGLPPIRISSFLNKI